MMARNNFTGKYTKAFLTDKKAELNSIEKDYYDNLIEIKENEAVNIFSFKGNKLVFAKGFEKFTNLSDCEINMLTLVNLYAPNFMKFYNEFHDRLMLFLYNNNKNIDTFYTNVVTKFKDFPKPIMINHKVFETDKNGNLLSIIGRSTLDENLKTTDIIQYEFNGDFAPEFIDSINNDLEFKKCISAYNINIIEKLNEGKSFSEIADELNMCEEKIEINIKKLLKRFNLKDTIELIDFSKTNFLIPSQFKNL